MNDERRLHPTPFACELKLVAHFKRGHITYIVYKDKDGKAFTENILSQGRKKTFFKKFSTPDAYLLGYLLGNQER